MIAPDSSNISRRILGHRVNGPEAVLKYFNALAASTQQQLFREAQMYGKTRVMLNDSHWTLTLLPSRELELSLEENGHTTF